jgi:hypothetical protein
MREYSFIQTETEFIPQTEVAKANYAPDFGFENESWYKYGSQTENVGFKDSEYLSLYGKKCLEITSDSDTMKGAYKNVNNLAPGTYTLRVVKNNHVTREYTVVVGDTSVLQDVKIHLKGDINGDDAIDIADAVSVLNIMAEGAANADADINGDGTIDIADFVTILNMMAEQ